MAGCRGSCGASSRQRCGPSRHSSARHLPPRTCRGFRVATLCALVCCPIGRGGSKCSFRVGISSPPAVSRRARAGGRFARSLSGHPDRGTQTGAGSKNGHRGARGTKAGSLYIDSTHHVDRREPRQRSPGLRGRCVTGRPGDRRNRPEAQRERDLPSCNIQSVLHRASPDPRAASPRPAPRRP